jgi:hypothetical protein
MGRILNGFNYLNCLAETRIEVTIGQRGRPETLQEYNNKNGLNKTEGVTTVEKNRN